MIRWFVGLYTALGALAGLAAAGSLGAFVANWRLPVMVDQGLRAYLPTSEALWTDVGLLLLFAAQHSLLARPWIKGILPVSCQRPTYLITTAMVTFVLIVLWEPLPAYVWFVVHPAGVAAIHTAFGAGVALVLWSVLTTGAGAFLGLRRERETIRVAGPYRWVRHPMMVGTLLVCWAAPDMSQGHALFSGFMTVYVWIALFLEESDLVRQHGSRYVEYQRRVRRVP